MKEIYNGFIITFDEKEEVWFTDVNEEGKQNEYKSSDTRVQDPSLKKLKEKLDLIKRKKFERRPVLVRTSRYRHGGGNDKKYEPGFCEATMTSVSPNGTVWVVKKGEKHPEKFHISLYSTLDQGLIDVYEDNKENRAIIAEIEAAGEAEWRAEVAEKKARERLKGISGRKLYKAVYGKDLRD